MRRQLVDNCGGIDVRLCRTRWTRRRRVHQNVVLIRRGVRLLICVDLCNIGSLFGDLRSLCINLVLEFLQLYLRLFELCHQRRVICVATITPVVPQRARFRDVMLHETLQFGITPRRRIGPFFGAVQSFPLGMDDADLIGVELTFLQVTDRC